MKLSARVLVLAVTIISWVANSALSIRFPDRISENPEGAADQTLRIAVFALGSFWRSEVAFGCLDGVVRTAVGYAGGSKPSPEYRSLGDHAECVQVVIFSFIFPYSETFADLGVLRTALAKSCFLCQVLTSQS
ncbi:peptide methionine sulfoxide reductase a5 [Phtheirospermum japonicum]|uniref:peptide-methionine (S)-S-oxide reductase n=1 Tax=Phtheirospermum japonicum TaxID=374723 RepID=A0A830BQZ7_9LAMI|nr:peptide methionine sulfoxide reductase a5 [Phtheirospermum japonicum]